MEGQRARAGDAAVSTDLPQGDVDLPEARTGLEVLNLAAGDQGIVGHRPSRIEVAGPAARSTTSPAAEGTSSIASSNGMSQRLRQQALVVDQRVSSVDDPAALREPTAGIEPTGPGVGVKGIEANGVGRPRRRHGARVFERHASQALALVRHRDGHGRSGTAAVVRA